MLEGLHIQPGLVCQGELEDMSEKTNLSATLLNLLSRPCRLKQRKMDVWVYEASETEMDEMVFLLRLLTVEQKLLDNPRFFL